MKRFPHAKTFISEEVKKYENFMVQATQAKEPVIKFTDDAGEVVEEYAIAKSETVQDLINVVEQRGLKLKQQFADKKRDIEALHKKAEQSGGSCGGEL